jgi:hypothetical protein
MRFVSASVPKRRSWPEPEPPAAPELFVSVVLPVFSFSKDPRLKVLPSALALTFTLMFMFPVFVNLTTAVELFVGAVVEVTLFVCQPATVVQVTVLDVFVSK